MSLRKYKKIKYLGKGSYGAALLVNLRANEKKKFVIKEIVVGHLKESEQRAAMMEAEVLSQMQHSNITMYIESFVEGSKLYIVMEFADGGDLSRAIANRKETSRFWQENELMRILVQICLALKHVHDQNILHRDLKSQNIFLTNKGIVKLGDFGIAKVLDATDDQAKTQIGTPYYLSPEICESAPYGQSSDVWSLGVVTFELMALELPFQANSLPALVNRIISVPPNWQIIPKHYSKNLLDLSSSMLDKKPTSRPSLQQVVSTNFLKAHISKLLSYTLSNNSGGVCEQIPVAIPEMSQESRSSGESEILQKIPCPNRDVERLYEAQREEEQELKAAHLEQESAREKEVLQNREREREKLRRFREEMIRKKMTENGAVKLPASRFADRRDLVVRHTSSSSTSSSTNILQQYYDPPAYADAKKVQSEVNNARDQFFANRRAAAAVKARVEAEERGPGVLRAAGGAGVRSGAEWDRVDAEEKIAALRAKKEKEKEFVLAEKELELKRAHEANRQERKRLGAIRINSEDNYEADTARGFNTPQRTREAVAFEIDISPGRGEEGDNVLKKLQDRRVRDRDARERARLVFRRLQEQRKIQQRVQDGKKITGYENDICDSDGKSRGNDGTDARSSVADPANADDDDLGVTIDRFLGDQERTVLPHNLQCEEKVEHLYGFQQSLDREAKKPFEEELSSSLFSRDIGMDEEDNDDTGGVEDMAGMLARELIDDVV